MAETITVRDAVAGDLDGCAALLSARHARDRARTAVLPERFERAEACVELLAPLFGSGTANGAVAEVGGELAGFMFGQRAMHAPDHWLAQYVPPRSLGVPVHGHGVAEGFDLPRVYGSLYAQLAAGWTAGGFFRHRIGIPAGDPEQREVWFQLGFGAAITYAVRDVSPLGSAALASDISIREATVEDQGEVERLEQVNSRVHNQSPVFWPYVWDDVAESASGLTSYALDREHSAVFLATRGMETLGMQLLFSGDAIRLGSGLSTQEGSVYLNHGIVDPDVRGGGVGTALLEQSLSWAREVGYQQMTLHYATMNPSGGPFWQRHGFTPLEYAVERQIDERVAWARPRD
ncbi:MAG: GNAT family N-acetyltransferase [Dehalococcoidia bacterium]|nr:GNAT family N-acetyltransferase [Dehalococcoidia bacterium]